MSNSKTKVYEQIDKLSETAAILAVCQLAISALDIDYEGDKDGLHYLLSNAEATVKNAIETITSSRD